MRLAFCFLLIFCGFKLNKFLINMKAMEALKAAHREELERARRLCGETAHMDSSHGDQM